MNIERAKKRVEFHEEHDKTAVNSKNFDANTDLCICILHLCSSDKEKKEHEKVELMLQDKNIVKDLKEVNGVYFLTTPSGYVISFSKASSVTPMFKPELAYQYHDCFKNSFNYAIHSQDACDFVVGTYNFFNDEDVGMLHAWNEFDKFVLDSTFNICMKKKDFFHFFKANRLATASKEQLKEDLLNGFYGQKMDIRAFYLARNEIIKNHRRKR